MFVGESGIGRIVQRSCELMKEHDTDDLRAHGGIDLATLQRFINFHFSVSVDLFGSETSTNAGNYYTSGLKGRFQESRKEDDHRLKDATYEVTARDGDGFRKVEKPALTALNESLRDDYIRDCERGVARWNKIIQRHDIRFRLTLPHRTFHRGIGDFANLHATPGGGFIGPDEWQRRRRQWLPTEDDYAFVSSLMHPVSAPGGFAGWIAPPARGIDGRPLDFHYVRLD